MYIIKNALRCIGRSKGRNILIGIIALVIAVSACIGLSIRQAAESAKASALDGMSVTATIGFDFFKGTEGQKNTTDSIPTFDRDAIEELMKGGTSLSLEEYQHFATASTVKSFYYTLTAYFNGSEGFEKVTTSSSSENPWSGMPNMGGFMPDFGGNSRVTGDFTVVGYSDRNAMTEFLNGNASLLDDGSEMFAEGTSDLVCIIPEELAEWNDYLSVGDTITITNPSVESETYTLTVVGIYTSKQGSYNSIYMSANALQSLLDASAASDAENCVQGNLSGTYSFANTDDFYTFQEEVYTLGLGESYTVESSDLSAFEQSLTPLNTLGTMAGWFLIIILIIGGVILVVLNIFNVRERKYEVGVLTAMGMKKWKVAAQFICEILIVTMIAVVIGAGIGAVSSVPVTNALLKNQSTAQTDRNNRIDAMFDPSGMAGSPGNMPSMDFNGMQGNGGGGRGPMGDLFDGAADYITEVNSATNLTVVIQMVGVGLLLTLIASAASVLFIMRYDPLKILSNRD